MPTFFAETCELLDAAVYTGDTLRDPESLSQFEEYLDRWKAATNEIKKARALEEARKTELHIDFLGKPLLVGDPVLFMQQGTPTQGRILKLEDTCVLLSHRNSKGWLVSAVIEYAGIVKVAESADNKV